MFPGETKARGAGDGLCHVHDLSIATGVAGLENTDTPVWAEITHGEGPTVVLCGGIHGDEHEAQIVLTDLITELDPAQVRGRIIVIPVLNYPAALAGQRVSDADGQNMNRVFPGIPNGTPTERIAHWLTSRIFPQAELLIDVHAGGRAVAVVPMVFGFSDEHCRTGPDALERILKGWGYERIQHMDCVPGTVCHAALRLGLASVEVEGGGGPLHAREIEIMKAGVLNGLVACGVLVGTPATVEQIEFDAPDEGQIRAPADGAVEHLVPLGARVEPGQIIARLYPIGGSARAPVAIVSPLAGLLLRQCQSAWLRRGSQIGNIGVPRVG